MTEAAETRTLRDYLSVLREQRVVVIATTLLAAAAAVTYSVIKDPTYEATANVSFKDEAQDLQELGVQGVPNLQPAQQAAANAKIVTRNDVVESVQNDLGTDLTEDELRDRIQAEVQPTSNLVEITASAPEADEAANLANAFARHVQSVAVGEARQSYADAANRIRALLKTEADPTTAAAYRSVMSRLITLSTLAEPVEITRPAEVPDAPVSPKPIRDALLAGFLGLCIGIGAAFLRNSLDRRLTASHDIQKELNLPLVGYVRTDALGQANLSLNGDRSFTEDDLEPFRILKANVDFLVKDQSLRTLAVTSPLAEEGKSTVAAWFAYASAVAGRRTLLVECDFRRPVLAARLGIPPAPGLSEFLGGADVKPQDILRPVDVSGVHATETLPVIPAGESAFQPAEMIASKRFQDFLGQVSRAYDLVVIDTAPLLPVGDTLELLPQVDGVLLCVRLGQTTRDQAEAAKAATDRLPEKPVGLVVTGVPAGSENDYYGYYAYSPAARSEASR